MFQSSYPSSIIDQLQRPQQTQIIWVCPVILFFSSVLHLSDIWAICRKCQFDKSRVYSVGWKWVFHYFYQIPPPPSLFFFLWEIKCDMLFGHFDPFTFVDNFYFLVQWTNVCISVMNWATWWLRAFVTKRVSLHLWALLVLFRLRLLLRHSWFDSDFTQISQQQIGGWGLCLMPHQLSSPTECTMVLLVFLKSGDWIIRRSPA